MLGFWRRFHVGGLSVKRVPFISFTTYSWLEIGSGKPYEIN